jgi:hypothetical protein
MEEDVRRGPADTRAGRLARQGRTTALLVLVLGVLPYAANAHPMWRLVGPLVAALFAVRWLQLCWQQVFGTDPRRLPLG